MTFAMGLGSTFAEEMPGTEPDAADQMTDPAATAGNENADENQEPDVMPAPDDMIVDDGQTDDIMADDSEDSEDTDVLTVEEVAALEKEAGIFVPSWVKKSDIDPETRLLFVQYPDEYIWCASPKGYLYYGGYAYFYYRDGSFATGLTEIDGHTYYFGKSRGIMYRQKLVLTDGKRYYFNKKGHMLTGFRTVSGNRYYFDPETGAAATGLTTVDGKVYYFNKKGVMLTGLRLIDGKRYYFKQTGGYALSGWRTIGGERYYFDEETCAGHKGLLEDDGKTYYFKKSGIPATGLIKVDGDVYNLDENGVLFHKLDKDKPTVALTFDDGPSANTQTILNCLKANGGLATFFVVGNRLSSFGNYSKAAVEMGCQVANHSWSHPWFTQLSSAGISNEIYKCSDKIESVTGKAPTVVRTPGGFAGATINQAVGMPIILWSIDTMDWSHRNPDKTYNAVIGHVSDGSIVLMHDLYSQTAEAAVRIIPKLRAQGYQLATIDELALLKGIDLQDAKVYHTIR